MHKNWINLRGLYNHSLNVINTFKILAPQYAKVRIDSVDSFSLETQSKNYKIEMVLMVILNRG